jgi:hypothetical protein
MIMETIAFDDSTEAVSEKVKKLVSAAENRTEEFLLFGVLPADVT